MTDPLRLLVVQNDPTGPVALLGEWWREAGVESTVIRADQGEAVPTELPDGYDGLVLLGGAMAAWEDDVAPWLPDVRALISDAVDRDVPLLGLCLGSQLLAVATGGSVDRAPVTEIGLVDVRRTVDGLVDPVLGAAVPAAGADIPAAQWHQDHVSVLPDAAVLLLTNDDCRVQGFRVGGSAYGLQLHPELDATTFADWAAMPDEALDASGIDAQAAAEAVAAAEADLVRDYLDRFDKTGRALGLGPARVIEVEDKKNAGRAAEGVDRVVVATDDERIAAHVRGFGGEANWLAPGAGILLRIGDPEPAK